MKKSKIVTGLSAAFISAMALMSCSTSLKANGDVVLTIDGIPYTAEELFEDQKTPAAAEAKFNAVYKVAIRAYFKKNTADKDEIENNTKIKINEQKATAQSNADANGTSYAEEWQKILDSNGVDDEQGLYDKFEYDLQKEKFESKLYNNNYDVLRNGGQLKDEEGKKVGEDIPGYLANKMPYHIRHILVKIAGMKGGDGVNAEITADEAEKLYGVITKLANGVDFADVSKDFNDDTTAKENGGSLGIMSRDTSFVNDFKLGIYLYESFYGKSTVDGDPTYVPTKAFGQLFPDGAGTGAGKTATDISKLVDPSTTTDPSTATAGLGIGQIPYEAAEKLHEYAKLDFDDTRIKEKFEDADLSKDDVAAKYLPRNVIFNKYFNKHNIMVITPRKMHNYIPTATSTIKDWVKDGGKKRNGQPDFYLGYVDPDTTEGKGYTTLEGFKRDAKNGDILSDDIKLPTETPNAPDNRILRDENGRTILVFRSGTGDSSSNDAYQGIHFVVIERSPFIGQEYDKDEKGVIRTEATTSDEYYTEYYPGQATGDDSKHHPVYGTYDPKKEDNDWKHTFVYYFRDTSLTNLKSRADTVKEELKKCTDRLDTYIYDYLLKTGDVKFNPDVPVAGEIEKSITDWIKLTRTSKKIDEKKTWEETWQDYYYSLVSQNEQRKEEKVGEVATGTVYSRLVPEACALAFADLTETETDKGFDGGTEMLKKIFGKGGVFHE